MYLITESFIVGGYHDHREQGKKLYDNYVDACIDFSWRLRVAKAIADEYGFDCYFNDVDKEHKYFSSYLEAKEGLTRNNLVSVELQKIDITTSDSKEEYFNEMLMYELAKNRNVSKEDLAQVIMDEDYLDRGNAEMIAESFLSEAQRLYNMFANQTLLQSYIFRHENDMVYLSTRLHPIFKKDIARILGIKEEEIEAAVIKTKAVEGKDGLELTPADIYIRSKNSMNFKSVGLNTNLKGICLDNALRNSLEFLETTRPMYDYADSLTDLKTWKAKASYLLDKILEMETGPVDDHGYEDVDDNKGWDDEHNYEHDDETVAEVSVISEETEDTTAPEKPFSDKELEIIKDFFEHGGMTVASIARKYKVGYEWLRTRVRKYQEMYNVEVNPLTDKETEIIKDYFNTAEMTVADAARKYNVSYEWLFSKIKKYQKLYNVEGKPAIPRKPVPLTDEEMTIVDDYFDSNMTIAEVARKYNIGYEKAYNTIRRYKKASGDKGISNHKKEILRSVEEYLNSDMTMNEIAAKYGVSQPTIATRVNRYRFMFQKNPRQKPLSEEEEAMVKDYFDTKSTIADTAVKYNMSVSRFYTLIKKYQAKYGIKSKPRFGHDSSVLSLTKEEIEMVKDCLENGKTRKANAEKYGISESALRRRIKKYKEMTG